MVSRLTIALSAALFAAGLCASPASAQGRGGRGGGSPARGGTVMHFGPPRGGRRGGFGHARRGRFLGSGEYVPFPYYYPYGYYPFGGNEQEPPAPAPPARVVVVHPPAPAPQKPPPESLLLEDHNGKWVRVPTGSHVPTGPLSTQPESAEPSSSQSGAARQIPEAQPLVKVPNTILVFRNGRKEEITKYVIHGAVIYAGVDYWSTGSWTKKIPISELNVPATLKLNRERGVKFSLPSGPDEVMVGF